jgi:hypothetical protein
LSIDLNIAPRRAAGITWASLRRQWQQRLGDETAGLLGPDAQLCRIGAPTQVAEDERLVPSSHYSFNLVVPCTLSLSMMENAPDLDETLYLEDYGRNLDAATIAELAEQWSRVGHNYEISSGGGRSKVEPALFIALACALADLCDGHVIVMNDGVFDLGVGVYTPALFSSARWSMS